MSKSVYRTFLLDIKPYVKISAFCKMLGINQSTVSLFMRSPEHDYQLSEDSLKALCKLIAATLSDNIGNFV